MKKTLIASVLLGALFSGSAMAADMPLKAPMIKAPPPPVYNWTGFYLDAGGGYGMWTADTETLVATGALAGTCRLCVDQIQGGRGWFGTVSAGWDYQWSDRIVIGILADYDFSDIRGTIQDQDPFFVGTVTQKWAWAAGGRIGWLITPQVLTYVNGGYTQARFSGANMVSSLTNVAAGFATPAFTPSGYFIGSGVEISLSSWLPGLYSRSEYRYAQYRSTDLPDANLVTPLFPDNTIRVHPQVQTVRSELVYKFNWASPSVVAKY
jgi:outer membrane immunogenic protein